MALSHIQEHVEVIARHELEFLARRSRFDRIADSAGAFIGSLPFVVGHIIFFALWIMWNSHLHQHTRRWRFDPPPFSLLGNLVSAEGLLAASFILIRQTRLAKRAEERDHLMLQVLLLSEKEITTVLDAERQIARKLGVEGVANDPTVRELSRETSIDAVAQSIREGLDGYEASEEGSLLG